MSSQVLKSQVSQRDTAALDVWVRLLRGHAAMRRSFDAQLQAEHGIAVNGYETLMLLSRAEDLSLRRVDLAERLQLTASGVTRLLDGLEKAGLVEKGTCASDARVTYAVLTKAGMAKLEKASNTHIAAIKALFLERYTSEELGVLADLLARLPGAAGAEGTECET